MGQFGTVAEQLAIQERRRKLKQRVVKFHCSADAYYRRLEDSSLSDEDDEDEEAADPDPDLDEDPLSEDEEEEEIKVESIQLRMPHTLLGPEDTSEHLQTLAAQELELRKGQANDALRQLRLLVGHKSLVYENDVREADTTARRTRAWTEVKNLQDKLQNYADIYKSARAAMVALGASEEVLGIYQELTEADLSVSKDALKQAAARTGQRNDILSWIWRLDGQNASEGDDWMDECKYYSPFLSTSLLYLSNPYSLQS